MSLGYHVPPWPTIPPVPFNLWVDVDYFTTHRRDPRCRLTEPQDFDFAGLHPRCACPCQQAKSFVCAPGIVAEYIYFWLRFKRDDLQEMGSGTTFLEISGSRAKEIPILLAPIAEQKRLAVLLRDLLENAKIPLTRLHKSKLILKNFRQAVLAAACSGKLTEDWRRDNPNCMSAYEVLASLRSRREAQTVSVAERSRIREIYQHKEENNSSDLPDTWRYICLNKLCQGFSYGTSAKSQRVGKVPVLRMGNIQNGEVDWSDLVYTSDCEEIQKYSLQPNTVLFNRTNSPELVGKSAIYRGEGPAIFAGYLIRITHLSELDPRYLNLCLNSIYAREFCLRVKTDGVSQSNINAQKLGVFEVPYCSLKEQEEIVRRVEALFKMADAIEKRVAAASARAEHLTQAVLAKAFRGELVPTEAELASREGRDYEAASVLLERIKAGRESRSSAKPHQAKAGHPRGRRRSKVGHRSSEIAQRLG
jgi:type I restriction enzyme S subunit